MPFYDFSCVRCGERFELMRMLKDRDEPAACPVCGHGDTRRELPRINMSVGASSAAPACGMKSSEGCGSAGFG